MSSPLPNFVTMARKSFRRQRLVLLDCMRGQTAELAKFAPALKLAVLHGLDRLPTYQVFGQVATNKAASASYQGCGHESGRLPQAKG